MTKRLSNQALQHSDIHHLNYDRTKSGIGIVHFGPGAFHRAHQAVYTDNLLRLEGGDWGICEVSINTPGFRDAVAPQDNLYTLSVLDKTCFQQIIGAIKEVLVAPERPAAVIERLANPETKAVTLTITEKGYCLTPDGHLDTTNESIQKDLSNPDSPKTAIGFLVAGLMQRYHDGNAPFVIISCDNLTNNGKRLGTAVTDFANHIDPSLGEWVKQKVRFPNTMVDSITPATDDQVRSDVAKATGFEDAWPVQRERFTQWVIEDLPGTTLPPWDRVGAIFSNDVHGYEMSKLRILNGMHSSIAFVGLAAGIETVGQAIKEDYIKSYITHTLNNEIIPTLKPVSGLDLQQYSSDILERFENPAIQHYLSQIAWDSSQKIPFRLLGTIQDNLKSGRSSPGLSLAIAAWILFIEKMTRTHSPISDPLALRLMDTANKPAISKDETVSNFLNINEMFPEALANHDSFRRAVISGYTALKEQGPESVCRAISQDKPFEVPLKL